MIKKLTHNLQVSILIIAVIIFNFIFPSGGLFGATMPAYERLEPITDYLDSPTSIALDAYENLYVAESTSNRLIIFSQSGSFLNVLSGLKRPISIDVDRVGKIYIGNDETGNVEVYNNALSMLFMLGSGDGEFSKPGAIAVSDAGDIYVADSGENKVKVYNPDGSFKFSFGTSGSGNGQFTFPTSIAIDEISQEIIISDLQVIQSSNGNYEGARIQVFDMNGGFKRSFGTFGQGDGKLTKPMGVAVDAAGRIYVTDAYQNAVLVFDTNGVFLGPIYDLSNPVRIPLGITLGKSNRLYIASLNNSRVEVYGIDSYIQMTVQPSVVSFDGQQYGSNPLLQNIEVRNSGSAILNWVAHTGDSWINLLQTSGITMPAGTSIFNIGVNIAGLAQGTYAGTVEVKADSGATEIIVVNLTVIPAPVLSVTPASLAFTSTQGSIPVSQNILINNTGGGTLHWTALSDRPWILIDKGAGSAPDAIEVSLNISSLSEGTYTGNITITGEGSLGSPVIVPVTLNIIILKGTINVITNTDAATFTINGPASYSGSGANWIVKDAPTGNYAIIFGDVEKYITPPSEAQTLQANGSITFSGQYKEISQTISNKSKNIIVGAGPASINPAFIKVFHSEGTPAGVEFLGSEYSYGVNVASGDIDGDGFDEIITASGPDYRGPAKINIFDRKGNQLSALSFIAFNYKYGANIATGDFDGDGKSEVVTGTGENYRNPAYVKVFVFDTTQQKFINSGINLIAYNLRYGVKVTTGDVDGDGVPELITAPGHGGYNTGIIRIWKVDTSSSIGQWKISLTKEFNITSSHKYSVSITSEDVNKDGYYEIITGAIPYKNAADEIRIYDREGIIFSEFRANIARGYGVNVASGDVDGDGAADIIAGAGPYAGNKAYVKVFDAFGIEKSSFKALDTAYGANVATGNLGFEIAQ